MDTLNFVAEIYKVQTLVDRGLRVTLDLPEDAVVEVAKLMEYRRLGIAVQVGIEAAEREEVAQAKVRRDPRARQS